MTEIDILKQLLTGNHLNKEELKQADDLLKRLSIELKLRYV